MGPSLPTGALGPAQRRGRYLGGEAAAKFCRKFGRIVHKPVLSWAFPFEHP